MSVASLCCLYPRKLPWWYLEASPVLLLAHLTAELVFCFFSPHHQTLEAKYSLNSSSQEKKRAFLCISKVAALFLRQQADESCTMLRWGLEQDSGWARARANRLCPERRGSGLCWLDTALLSCIASSSFREGAKLPVAFDECRWFSKMHNCLHKRYSDNLSHYSGKQFWMNLDSSVTGQYQSVYLRKDLLLSLRSFK